MPNMFHPLKHSHCSTSYSCSRSSIPMFAPCTLGEGVPTHLFWLRTSNVTNEMNLVNNLKLHRSSRPHRIHPGLLRSLQRSGVGRVHIAEELAHGVAVGPKVLQQRKLHGSAAMQSVYSDA